MKFVWLKKKVGIKLKYGETVFNSNIHLIHTHTPNTQSLSLFCFATTVLTLKFTFKTQPILQMFPDMHMTSGCFTQCLPFNPRSAISLSMWKKDHNESKIDITLGVWFLAHSNWNEKWTPLCTFKDGSIHPVVSVLWENKSVVRKLEHCRLLLNGECLAQLGRIPGGDSLLNKHSECGLATVDRATGLHAQLWLNCLRKKLYAVLKNNINNNPDN